MTRLILARHGNTFRPEENPVWVGARTDLPLVAKGIAQAHTLGSALRQAKVILDDILSGPLQRTAETARIVAETLNLNASCVRIDNRLTEIDYGLWEGLSTTEIEDAGGGPELAAWNNKSIFPASPQWTPQENELFASIRSFLSDIRDETTLAITSNGILRFFARLAKNCDSMTDYKVSTGNICVMERGDGNWRIEHWNQLPDILKE